MLRNINNFFNIIKSKRVKKTLADNDMIPVGTRDAINKSKYQDTAITFKDFKSQVGGGGGGGVTAVTGAAPIVSSGGTTPAISIPAASSTVDGYLKSAEFASFTAKQDALTFNPPSSNNANPSTSAQIKTALDAKQATITGAATSIDEINLTASRALVSDGSGKVAVSPVTSTELGYLDGVSSLIQTQIDAKQDSLTLTTTGSGAATLVGSTLNIPTPTGGSGSWTTSGNNIYNNNTQNVGIGTTTPFSKLLVRGNGNNGMTNVFQLEQNNGTTWLTASDAGTLSLTSGMTSAGKLSCAQFQLTSSPAAGKVLTSDASGNASWQTSAGLNIATGELSTGSILMGSGTTILPTPASGLYYVIHSVVAKFKSGPTPFNQSPIYQFNLDRGVIDTSAAAAAGPATTITIPQTSGNSILAWVSGATALNQAFTISKVGGNAPTSGDGFVQFDVTYEIKAF